MNKSDLSHWLKANPFSAIECDCVTTVKLKILDGKCKMPVEEKVIMGALYEEIKQLPSQLFTDVHQFIESLGDDITESKKLEIYEKRLMAETMLSRPVMKKFKAKIRQAGLFDSPSPDNA